MAKIVEMRAFFNSVADDYEQHMFEFVDGALEYYQKTAEVISSFQPSSLLDLGCGTGLELDTIFKKLPHLKVIGVDLADKLLAKLKSKHPDKDLTLINKSYFDVDYGEAQFDCAVSVMTLHHFDYQTKLGLYKKIYASLKNSGHYVETDYMVLDEKEEAFYATEKKRLRQENNITGFDCYDSPLTVSHQLEALKEAGFKNAHVEWSLKNTYLLIADK